MNPERTEKWPRHYAAEIEKLPTAAQRRAALSEVPAHYQALVKEYVSSAFALRRHRR